MLKKLLPVVMLAFVTACADTQSTTQSGMDMKAHCCKSDQCKCCKDGMCKICKAKMKEGGMTSMKQGEECEICAKANKDATQKQHEGMKH